MSNERVLGVAVVILGVSLLTGLTFDSPALAVLVGVPSLLAWKLISIR